MSEIEEEKLDERSDGLQQALGEQEADFSPPPARRATMGQGTLLLLGLALAGMGGTWFMYLHSGPRSADAASVVQAKAADQTIQSFLNNSAAGRKLTQQLLHNTQKVVQRFMNYPSATQIPLRDLKANPFEHRPLAAAPGQDMSRLQEQQEQETRRAAILKSAQSLKLQSIIHSAATQACMIDNNLYRQGQNVGEFVIESIGPNAVILVNGAYRFELRMGK